MMRDGQAEIYGGYEIHMSDIGYDVRFIGSALRVKFDTLTEAYDYVDAKESEDTGPKHRARPTLVTLYRESVAAREEAAWSAAGMDRPTHKGRHAREDDAR